MASQILATKLYVPSPRPKIILRQRLLRQLNDVLHRKLTLISTLAGFGKTTLVSEWIGGCGRPVAWLSLGEGENDFMRFILYLVAALQMIKTGFGEGLLAAFQFSQPPSAESLLTALLNEAATLPDDFILILDDYPVVDAKPIDNALAFLLEHMPQSSSSRFGP